MKTSRQQNTAADLIKNSPPPKAGANLAAEAEKRGLVGCIDGAKDLSANYKKHLRPKAHVGEAAA